jgi:hypothetical protein
VQGAVDDELIHLKPLHLETLRSGKMVFASVGCGAATAACQCFATKASGVALFLRHKRCFVCCGAVAMLLLSTSHVSRLILAWLAALT